MDFFDGIRKSVNQTVSLSSKDVVQTHILDAMDILVNDCLANAEYMHESPYKEFNETIDLLNKAYNTLEKIG